MRTERTKRLTRGNSAFRIPHSAFTLVELLVVITIIGILAALLLAAIQRARIAAARARITAEINQIDTAIKDMKNSIGSFPPNTQTDADGPIVENTVLTDLKQFMLKAFPQHREPPQLLEALVGVSSMAPGGTPGANQATNLPGGMTAAEALVFWVGGFSDDPKYPISGPGGPSYAGNASDSDPIDDRSWQLSVNVQNLGPRSEDDYFATGYNRYITYADPRDPTGAAKRRINFWVLNAPGAPAPYLYFDASRGAAATVANDVPAATTPVGHAGSDELLEPLEQLKLVYAIKERKTTGTGFQFANNGAFQVLHPGFDREWPLMGPDGITPLPLPHVNPSDVTKLIPTETLFPDGPWTMELADTQANFANGTLESAQP